MTLHQFHSLKVWHLQQAKRHPVEKAIWDAVLTIWLIGWVGSPTAFMLHLGWAAAACPLLWFLPGSYVALRRLLHNKRRLRCDWIVALR